MREPAVNRSRTLQKAAGSVCLLLSLSACMTAAPPPAPVAAVPTGGPTNIMITAADLVGNWGLASYRVEADRARTETAAKAACNNPFKITPGPGGGAMMYLADQTKPSEVFVKTSPTGQVFIGPQGTPGEKRDRQVLEFNQTVLVADWMDAAVRERYGTMIFVRCGA